MEKVELGGAGKAAVQAIVFEDGGKTLRAKVKSILVHNLVQEMSLKEVGFSLFQCLLQCCKPLPMVELSSFEIDEPDSLAYAVQGDLTLKTWVSTTTLALQHLSGSDGPKLAELRCDPAEKEEVRKQLERFDVWDQKFSVEGFEKFFKRKTLIIPAKKCERRKNCTGKRWKTHFPTG